MIHNDSEVEKNLRVEPLFSVLLKSRVMPVLQLRISLAKVVMRVAEVEPVHSKTDVQYGTW